MDDLTYMTMMLIIFIVFGFIVPFYLFVIKDYGRRPQDLEEVKRLIDEHRKESEPKASSGGPQVPT